jgi:hypothetical protein
MSKGIAAVPKTVGVAVPKTVGVNVGSPAPRERPTATGTELDH